MPTGLCWIKRLTCFTAFTPLAAAGLAGFARRGAALCIAGFRAAFAGVLAAALRRLSGAAFAAFAFAFLVVTMGSRRVFETTT
ncbi:MAG TPA: hypothetical protein VET87_20760, partial [Rubrivivax sp.]|nr:hypothetical protein [Rubrivivax sp.]